MRILTIFILLFNSYYAFAQIMDNDQAKSSIKWEQINGENFRFVFPKEYREQASILSREFVDMQAKTSDDLRTSIRKINVILHATTIEQNGFVQLAPRKTEFFPIPSGIASNVEWLPNLAIHELRHVAQIDKMTGHWRKPFLEQAAFGLFGIQLPAWYFEGDAVSVETNHSSGGRGRLPSWFMPLRTNELSGRTYSFDKNILGSFKDITPSYYATGYLMNTHLTNSYGTAIKADMLEDLRRHLLRPFSFYFALKKHTGDLNSNRLYKQTVDSLHQIWQPESSGKTAYPHLKTAQNRYPSNYFLPQESHDGVLALINRPQQLPHIARIKDGREEHITYVGRQLMPHFHANAELIIWDEWRKNARFGKTTFNVINIHDQNTGKTKTMTFENPVYTPSLSNDNKFFTVVEVDESGLSSLIVFDLQQDTIRQNIALPRGLHIQQPRFNPQNNRIVAIGVQKEGMTLVEFNLETEEYETLLPLAHHQIERPVYHDQQIIYKAHYNGIDNIYAINLTDRTVVAITDTKFGAFNPSVGSEGALLFNDYTANGYKIASTPLNLLDKINLTHTTELNYDRHTPHNSSQQPAQQDNDTLAIKKYNPLAHLLNFHSLSISKNNFESFDNYRPGIFWLANDLLNTSSITLGYEYDTDIRKSIYSAEFNYSKYFPKLSLRYQNRGQIGQAWNPNTEENVNFDFREHLMIAEVQIPFSVYRRQHVYSYGINFGTSYQQRYDTSIALQNFRERIAFPLNYIVYFNRNRMRARMDLMPRWGQNISMSFRHTPFENGMSGQIFAVRSGFYFPGLRSNHGLHVRAAFQHKSGRYEFNNDIPIVSGFGHFTSPKLANTLLLTYKLPLGYPDWNIPPVAFIKRFTAELFADYQNIHRADVAPKTFGLGIYADLNAFRYILPDINVGGRLVYINDATASQPVVPMFSLSYTY